MTTSSIDDDLAQRVRAALAGVADVQERRMFGSLGFMVRGHLCITARPQRLMCRIDPALHEMATQSEGCETVVMKGRPYPGYVFVAAAAVETETALRQWVDLCLQHNASLPAAKAKHEAQSGSGSATKTKAAVKTKTTAKGRPKPKQS